MANDIDKIDIPLLLEYSASLPASPRIFARLSKLVANEDTALDYVAGIVKMDPGLAAQILRVTNSAYYGAAVKVNDLETAISRIGFREVHKVISMVVSHECFYQELPTYALTATDFSDQCINVAVASETLSKRIGVDYNAPYISGLLSGIGKLAINLYLEKLGQSVDLLALSEEKPLNEVEKEVLGITNWRAGYELLSHWQFESEVWQPIKNQYAPTVAPSYIRNTAILTLARWIAHAVAEGFDPDDEMAKETIWAFHKLSIDTLDAAMLIDEARFESNDRQNLFSMLL